jgi:hypothetical protein
MGRENGVKMTDQELNLERYFPGKKARKFPCVVIREIGISFNKPCFPAFHRKDFAELFYDRKAKIIAIKPYHIETLHTIKTSGNKKKGSLQVWCRPFIHQHNILELLQLEPHSDRKSKRFRAQWDEKKKWFLVNLKEDNV